MKAKNESLFTELTINESANVNGGYFFNFDDPWSIREDIDSSLVIGGNTGQLDTLFGMINQLSEFSWY